MSIDPQELQACVETLQRISEDVGAFSEEHRLKALVDKIHREGRKLQRRAKAASARRHDQEQLAQTGLVQLTQSQSSSPETSSGLWRRPRHCYICKQRFQRRHFWYHSLCPECAELNFLKRNQRTDLAGRTALITGGRIKIGHQLALRMLRDGAQVWVTTRFPGDCLERFRSQPDYPEWESRLFLVGLDLRNLPQLEQQISRWLDELPQLDILINNAAQTVRRPAEFYQHLLPQPSGGLQLPASEFFPTGMLDRHGQQLDLRPDNSWRLRLDEVSTLELLEVQLVNAVAPFLLAARLKPLMLRCLRAERFIVNVSAMEGQFARENKTIYHPHTNMAKAALNMLTRTSARDYSQHGIYINSVDTGWITDENPFPRAQRHKEIHEFTPPLDEVDGMARIYDPICCALQGQPPQWGHFLKDYRVHAW